jgi:hypothetical protein
MDIGSIFLLLGILVVVVLFIFQPFIDERKNKVLITQALPAKEKEMHVSSILAERDRILRALQELDFDFTLGKIPEEDYPTQRQFLLQKGAEVIKKLDEISGDEQSSDQLQRIEATLGGNKPEIGLDHEKIEKDVDVESMIAARKRSKESKPDGFCPKCGKPVSKTDKFCSKCGHTL